MIKILNHPFSFLFISFPANDRAEAFLLVQFTWLAHTQLSKEYLYHGTQQILQIRTPLIPQNRSSTCFNPRPLRRPSPYTQHIPTHLDLSKLTFYIQASQLCLRLLTPLFSNLSTLMCSPRRTSSRFRGQRGHMQVSGRIGEKSIKPYMQANSS